VDAKLEQGNGKFGRNTTLPLPPLAGRSAAACGTKRAFTFCGDLFRKAKEAVHSSGLAFQMLSNSGNLIYVI
jgi:hypothetical protein